MTSEVIVLMNVPDVHGLATLKGLDPGKDGSHEGWIPIESCTFSLSRKETATAKPGEENDAVKPVHTAAPVVIKRRADASTAPLLAWLADKTAPVKEEVLIDYCMPSGRYYLRYELHDVEIVSSAIAFTAPDNLTETITFTYGRLVILQRPVGIGGEVDVDKPTEAYYEVPRPEK
jgi:hypothetical protein